MENLRSRSNWTAAPDACCSHQSSYPPASARKNCSSPQTQSGDGTPFNDERQESAEDPGTETVSPAGAARQRGPLDALSKLRAIEALGHHLATYWTMLLRPGGGAALAMLGFHLTLPGAWRIR